MKVIGVIVVIVALLIAFVPQFNNCTYEGKAIELPGGATIMMKCYWTAHGALIVGIPLAVVGIAMATAKRKETLQVVSVLGTILSVFAVVLPTSLIGVCAMDALCVNVMQPTLIALGALGAVLSVIAFVLTMRMTDEGSPSEGAPA